MKRIITIITLITCLQSFSQKNDTSKEIEDAMFKWIHSEYSKLFIKPKYDVKKAEFIEDKRFIKSLEGKENITSAIKHFKKNAKLEFKFGNKFNNKAILISRFPKGFKPDGVKIRMIECNLIDENKNRINKTNTESTSFNFDVNHSTVLDSEFTNNTDFKGNVKYEINVVTDYKKQKISSNDIGKNIKVDNHIFKIKDIFFNKIVLELIPNKEIDWSNVKLGFVNFDSKNKEIKNKTIFSLSIAINKKVYNTFKSNPKTTIEEMKKITSFENINNSLKDKYLIYVTASDIDKNTKIFIPIYGAKEQLNIKL